MAKSIEPDVKNWFAQQLTANQTSYTIEQASLNSEIESALHEAPSKSGGAGVGRPDFQMMVQDPKSLKCYPVVVEAKGTINKMVKYDKNGKVELITKYTKDAKPNAVNQYKAGDNCYNTIQNYAVNGAIYYALNIIENSNYDSIIAVGVNGYDDTTKQLREVQIWYVSKNNGNVPKKLGDDISLLFSANVKELIARIENSSLSEKERETLAKNAENLIDNNLKKLNQMMHDGLHIESNNRVHLMAGMIMAGLGVEGLVAPLSLSELHGYTSADGHDGKVFINRIREFLRARNMPEEKRELVINKLNTVFVNAQGLWMPVNGVSKLKTLYSEVKQSILPYVNASQKNYLDFTGRLFNVLTGWVAVPDGDKNDVVLTPRYITNLMARLCQVNRNSYVWDFATGTAGFLVSAMRLMLQDADRAYPDNIELREAKKRDIRCNQLLGIELRDDIYLLAVLNMILMGDGSANIIMKDSLSFDGCYQQGPQKGQKFPANVLLLNPPYSAPGKGFNFVKKAFEYMNTGKAAVLIQESAGGGQGTPYTRDILKGNTLIASIHCANIFLGKANVQTAIYVFEVGKPHNPDKEVIFIDMRNDGYTRQNRKNASAEKNLQNTDHAIERYDEIVDIVSGNKKKTDFYRDGHEVVRDTIELTGDDWTYLSHMQTENKPSEEDFQQTISDYLAHQIKWVLGGKMEYEM